VRFVGNKYYKTILVFTKEEADQGDLSESDADVMMRFCRTGPDQLANTESGKVDCWGSQNMVYSFCLN
jgi:hypothetical protein